MWDSQQRASIDVNISGKLTNFQIVVKGLDKLKIFINTYNIVFEDLTVFVEPKSGWQLCKKSQEVATAESEGASEAGVQDGM